MSFGVITKWNPICDDKLDVECPRCFSVTTVDINFPSNYKRIVCKECDNSGVVGATSVVWSYANKKTLYEEVSEVEPKVPEKIHIPMYDENDIKTVTSFVHKKTLSEDIEDVRPKPPKKRKEMTPLSLVVNFKVNSATYVRCPHCNTKLLIPFGEARGGYEKKPLVQCHGVGCGCEVFVEGMIETTNPLSNGPPTAVVELVFAGNAYILLPVHQNARCETLRIKPKAMKPVCCSTTSELLKIISEKNEN